MNTIIFDLDGTLLPMDLHKFIELYNIAIGESFADLADPEVMVKGLWSATKHTIVSNDLKPNIETFFEDFSKRVPGKEEDFINRFEHFYENGFSKVQESTSVSPEIVKAIRILKEKGYRLIIATNPMFPLRANHIRIGWAGLDVNDFDYISNFELNTLCKPKLEFYQQVIDHNNLDIKKSLMVGNDVQEDLVVTNLGMKTYLINECLINRGGDYFTDYESDYSGFLEFVNNLGNASKITI